MPDQNVTDDDRRKARQWAMDTIAEAEAEDRHLRYHHAARVILATIPAPPAPLADEIRGIRDSPFTKDMHKLSELADRVEAVEGECVELRVERDQADYHLEKAEEERDEAISDLTDQTRLTDRYVKARDEARAEVERLTVSLNRQCTTVTPSVHNTDGLSASSDTLPDRAEVERLTGRLAECQDALLRAQDALLRAQVERLVPDTRRVIDRPEELDKLPVGSVVLDNNNAASQRTPSGEWEYGYDTRTTEEMISNHGPVTVIHEPEVTA